MIQLPSAKAPWHASEHWWTILLPVERLQQAGYTELSILMWNVRPHTCMQDMGCLLGQRGYWGHRKPFLSMLPPPVVGPYWKWPCTFWAILQCISWSPRIHGKEFASFTSRNSLSTSIIICITALTDIVDQGMPNLCPETQASTIAN